MHRHESVIYESARQWWNDTPNAIGCTYVHIHICFLCVHVCDKPWHYFTSPVDTLLLFPSWERTGTFVYSWRSATQWVKRTVQNHIWILAVYQVLYCLYYSTWLSPWFPPVGRKYLASCQDRQAIMLFRSNNKPFLCALWIGSGGLSHVWHINEACHTYGDLRDIYKRYVVALVSRID